MATLPLTGAGKNSASLADGSYYYAVTASATPPLPTDTASWTITTAASDGVSPDHTTAVATATNASGATNYIHVMRYKASSVTWTTYTMVLKHKGQASGEVKLSVNGSAWATWDAAQVEADNGGVDTFVDYSRNPADTAGVAVCTSYRDDVGLIGTPPCSMAIFEFAANHA